MSETQNTPASAGSPGAAGSAADGFYWLSRPNGDDACLVKLYTHPDSNERGFGFGYWDGGGFLPLKDLCDGSRFTPAIIEPNSVMSDGEKFEGGNHE